MTQGPEDLKGWIALYRQLMAHWLWPKRRYSQLEAWLYMLFKTNYERRWWTAGKTWVERGELILSETKAATEWDWTRKEVRCFWEKLKREQMIEWLPEKKRFTKIRIVNYDKYQIPPEELRNILKGDKRGDKSGYKENPELARLEGVQGDNPGDKRGDITKQVTINNKKDFGESAFAEALNKLVELRKQHAPITMKKYGLKATFKARDVFEAALHEGVKPERLAEAIVNNPEAPPWEVVEKAKDHVLNMPIIGRPRR